MSCSPLCVYASSRCMSCSRFLLFPTPCISMPVHPHFADLSVFRFAENRPARVYLLTRAAAPEGALELRREPRARLVDLAGLKAHFGLVDGNVLPVAADRRDPRILLTEGGFLEHRVRREHRRQQLDVPPLPALPESVDQLPVGRVHGAPNIPQSGTHAASVCMTGVVADAPDRTVHSSFRTAANPIQEVAARLKR